MPPGASPFPPRSQQRRSGRSEGSSSSSSTVSVPTEATFILKWGAHLLGEAQSTLLGAKFRNIMYPGEMAGVLGCMRRTGTISRSTPPTRGACR